MLNYQVMPDLNQAASRKRVERAVRVLGAAVVTRIVALGLYLLGANRKGLAALLGMPLDTAKALVQRVMADGLPALEDRRCQLSTWLPAPPQPRALAVSELMVKDNTVVVGLDGSRTIEIPRQNRIQCRTLLLSLLNSKVLTIDQVAEGTELSAERVRKLARKLIEEDVPGVIDQRRGQQHDYRVTEEVKAELIQQFVANVETNTPTSSAHLSEDLKQRCQIEVASRTIRVHLGKMGLNRLRRSLPELLAALKKTPDGGV